MTSETTFVWGGHGELKKKKKKKMQLNFKQTIKGCQVQGILMLEVCTG